MRGEYRGYMRHLAVSLLLSIAASGCRSSAAPQSSEDAGPTPDGSQVGPSPSAQPFQAGDFVTVRNDHSHLDYGSAAFERSDGAWVVVFEEFTSDTELAGRLLRAVSTDHLHFDTIQPLDFAAGELQLGPENARLGNGDFLYFMGGSHAKSTIHRARFDPSDGTFGGSTKLTLTDGYMGVAAWPKLAVIADGSVALGYNHYQNAAPTLALGDGLHFGAPQTLGAGVQGRPGAFAHGGLVYTYQDGQLPDTVYVRFSGDGVAFTEAVPLTSGPNPHDATPFARLDGDIDIYYSATSALGFTIARRHVRANGTIAPEELVSDPTAGSFTQPHPVRLRDGSILLTFAVQVTSNVDTDTACAHIAGDGSSVERPVGDH